LKPHPGCQNLEDQRGIIEIVGIKAGPRDPIEVTNPSAHLYGIRKESADPFHKPLNPDRILNRSEKIDQERGEKKVHLGNEGKGDPIPTIKGENRRAPGEPPFLRKEIPSPEKGLYPGFRVFPAMGVRMIKINPEEKEKNNKEDPAWGKEGKGHRSEGR
jgi:hypothetical protein